MHTTAPHIEAGTATTLAMGEEGGDSRSFAVTCAVGEEGTSHHRPITGAVLEDGTSLRPPSTPSYPAEHPFSGWQCPLCRRVYSPRTLTCVCGTGDFFPAGPTCLEK